MRKLLCTVCTLVMLLSMLTVTGPAASAAAKKIVMKQVTDVGSMSGVSDFDGLSWGILSGTRTQTVIGGENYLRYYVPYADGAALPSNNPDRSSILIAPEDRDWSQAQYIEIKVKNDGWATMMAPYYFTNGAESENVWMTSTLKEQVTLSSGETLAWIGNYMTIPAGFNGVVRIPVGEASDYSACLASGTWDGYVSRLGFLFSNNYFFDMYIGDAYLAIEEELPVVLPEEDTLTPIMGYTDAQIAEFNVQGWGMPSGSRTRVVQDGTPYLRYAAPAEYGKAYIPVREKYQDFTKMEYFTFRVINNLNTVTEIAPLFYMDSENAGFMFDPGNMPAIKTLDAGGYEQTLLTAQQYITIPASFDGIVMVPVPAGAAQLANLVGGSTSMWNAAKVSQVGFHFRNFCVTDILVGEYFPVYKSAYKASAGSAVTANGVTTVTFTDNGKPIGNNPLRGVEICMSAEEVVAYGVPDGYDIVNLRDDWSVLEPEEGQFFWEDIDKAVAICKALNVSVELSLYLMPSDVYPIDGMPQWVWDSGVPYEDVTQSDMMGRPDDFTTRHPLYWNALYQSKLRNFLDAVAAHFNDGEVSVVYVRPYGLYGEWDSLWCAFPWNQYPSQSKSDVLGQLVDIYAEAFAPYERTRVFIDFPAGTGTRKQYQDYMKEIAFDKALAHGFGVRTCAIGPILANDEFLRYLVEDYWPQTPIVCETYYGWEVPDYYLNLNKTNNDTLDNILAVHGNSAYYGWNVIFSNPNTMRSDNIAFFNRMQTELGYRLLPKTIQYASSVMAGHTVTVNSVWNNSGSGVCWQQFPLKYTLMNDEGREVYSYTDTSVDQRLWTAGTDYNAASALSLPANLPAGEYSLYVSMVDPEGKDSIYMPIGGIPVRRYHVGTIAVEDFAALPGDANANGTVDGNDIDTVKNYLLGLGKMNEAGILNVDFDESGEVDILDLLALKEWISG